MDIINDIREQVCYRGSQFEIQIQQPIYHQIWIRVDEQVEDQVDNQVDEQIYNQIRDQVRNLIREQLIFDRMNEK